MKIAFITYRKQERHAIGTSHDEHQVLLDFLLEKGLDIEPAIWNDHNIDWTKYNAAILKAPWDYHEQYSEFTAWLNHIEALGIRLQNPYPIVRWNCDKHYMQDIEDSRLAVIPSLFVERDTQPVLSDYFSKLGSNKLIIKPCVSASAKNTMVVTPENVAGRQVELHAHLKEDSFLVQPFVDEIHNGELSLIFLGDKYSHSVQKLPKHGDFRVQHFHGGTIKSYTPTDDLINIAAEYVAKFAPGCLYARVDGVMTDGVFQLMELELIEPYLFLGTIPEGYQRYYDAIQDTLLTP